ncbi:hypothetical protein MMPV_005395 [Pyropia vietnamensis]
MSKLRDESSCTRQFRRPVLTAIYQLPSAEQEARKPAPGVHLVLSPAELADEVLSLLPDALAGADADECGRAAEAVLPAFWVRSGIASGGRLAGALAAAAAAAAPPGVDAYADGAVALAALALLHRLLLGEGGDGMELRRGWVCRLRRLGGVWAAVAAGLPAPSVGREGEELRAAAAAAAAAQREGDGGGGSMVGGGGGVPHPGDGQRPPRLPAVDRYYATAVGAYAAMLTAKVELLTAAPAFEGNYSLGRWARRVQLQAAAMAGAAAATATTAGSSSPSPISPVSLTATSPPADLAENCGRLGASSTSEPIVPSPLSLPSALGTAAAASAPVTSLGDVATRLTRLAVAATAATAAILVPDAPAAADVAALPLAMEAAALGHAAGAVGRRLGVTERESSSRGGGDGGGSDPGGGGAKGGCADTPDATPSHGGQDANGSPIPPEVAAAGAAAVAAAAAFAATLSGAPVTGEGNSPRMPPTAAADTADDATPTAAAATSPLPPRSPSLPPPAAAAAPAPVGGPPFPTPADPPLFPPSTDTGGLRVAFPTFAALHRALAP